VTRLASCPTPPHGGHTALRASPCNHDNLDISANAPKLPKPPPSVCSCRSPAAAPAAAIPHGAPSGSSHTTSTISKRPARSRRRPFGVPSPCRRTNQKTAGSHGTSSLDDHPPLLRQQVSARAPITQHYRASARARTRARPAAPITSPHTSTTSLTPLVQLTSARALLALRHALVFALRRAPAVFIRPSPLGRWVHPCPHNSSPCAGAFTPYTRADPAGAPAWRNPAAIR
jgi:hypothetical protein